MTPVVVRLLLLVGILALATAGYLWWAARQGRVRLVGAADAGGADAPGALTPEDLGAPRGQRATLVQFSTPMCAKCPGVKALLHDVIADEPHVGYVEIDASERLDLARELSIMRTPTTLVLDARGVPVARIDGVMTRAQVLQALDAVPPAQDYTI